MKYPVDLQVHSTYSPDAEFTSDELFNLAKQQGMHAIAITDHNVALGIPRAISAANKYGLETLQAIEMSTKYKKIDVHVLGYSNNFNLGLLNKETESTRNGYNDRSKEIVKKINEAKVADIDFEQLFLKYKDSYVSKPAIAQEIAKQKQIDYKEAIKYVERGGIGYVPYGDWAMRPHEAVNIIHRAGGIAILAHPGDFFTTRSSESQEVSKKILYHLLDELISIGLDGLEVYYSKHQPKWIEEFKLFAQNNNLLISGGSDYHGPAYNNKINIGDGGISIEQFTLIKNKLVTKK